jgi:hypothetical protein
MLRKQALVLGAIVAALAGATALDKASADLGSVFDGINIDRPGRPSISGRKADQAWIQRPEPEPKPTVLFLPRDGSATASRRSNRDMRMAPSIGGRGMRSGVRMNGGMRRR